MTPDRDDIQAHEISTNLIAAFKDQKPNGKPFTLYSEVYMDYEGNQLAQYLEGKTWRDLHWDSMQKDYPCDVVGSISFLSEDGLTYFLPGYIAMAIENASEGDLADALCWNLSRSANAEVIGAQTKLASILNGMSKAQFAAIASAISFLAEKELRRGIESGAASTLWHSIQQ